MLLGNIFRVAELWQIYILGPFIFMSAYSPFYKLTYRLALLAAVLTIYSMPQSKQSFGGNKTKLKLKGFTFALLHCV